MKKSALLSIVSHNNETQIIERFTNFPARLYGWEINIVIVDNVGSSVLKSWANNNGYLYLFDGIKRGYGANNNLAFKTFFNNSSGVFIVCNPDVTVEPSSLVGMLDDFRKDPSDIMGVRVYESHDLSDAASHNRLFPCLLDPIISLVFKRKLFARNPECELDPDWVGGCFMIFKASSFRQLNGFDERFFMYYEDTDICHRAVDLGMVIRYKPGHYIVHEAARRGRDVFSKHFVWNLISMTKYFLSHRPRCLLSLTPK